MKRVQFQSAYVLHRRAYRESSFIVDLFTAEYGRLSVVARGVRKDRSASQGLLQPFIPLLVSWSGKGELMTLSQVEPAGESKRLNGDCLYAGLYLNELLTYLLQKWDAHTKLYHVYEKALTQLQANILEEKILRLFEKHLLEELGYGLLPKSDHNLKQYLNAEKNYRFIPEQGLVIYDQPETSLNDVFSGKSLLAIIQEDFTQAETLRDAKRLSRFILTPLLGARPIYSRRLFMVDTKHEN